MSGRGFLSEGCGRRDDDQDDVTIDVVLGQIPTPSHWANKRAVGSIVFPRRPTRELTSDPVTTAWNIPKYTSHGRKCVTCKCPLHYGGGQRCRPCYLNLCHTRRSNIAKMHRDRDREILLALTRQAVEAARAEG